MRGLWRQSQDSDFQERSTVKVKTVQYYQESATMLKSWWWLSGERARKSKSASEGNQVKDRQVPIRRGQWRQSQDSAYQERTTIFKSGQWLSGEGNCQIQDSAVTIRKAQRCQSHDRDYQERGQETQSQQVKAIKSKTGQWLLSVGNVVNVRTLTIKWGQQGQSQVWYYDYEVREKSKSGQWLSSEGNNFSQDSDHHMRATMSVRIVTIMRGQQCQSKDGDCLLRQQPKSGKQHVHI